MWMFAIGCIGKGCEDIFFGEENGGDGGKKFLEVCFTGHWAIPFFCKR